MKNILTKLYGGAFENVELSSSSRRALFGAGGVVLIGFIAAVIIRKNDKL